MIIDSHQHFWQYNAVKDAWIDDSMQILQRDFMPKDLEMVLNKNKVNGCVAVQADQSENETEFLLNLAENNPFIKAVVGWVKLSDLSINQRLEYFSEFKALKGFRHILQAEPPEFMLNADFKLGISLLQKYNFSYDILVFPYQLPNAIELVHAFPNQMFVLDHLGKPNIKSGENNEWQKNIKTLGNFENVYCKISGMTTEADWEHWNENDLEPYLDVVINAFGTKKILFGSDWPVCLLATSYQKWLQFLQHYFSRFSQTEQDNFFAKNTMKCYRI